MAKAELVVKSKIKACVKDCNVAGDVAARLNDVANELVTQAAARAKANGRRTIQAKDAFIGKKTAKEMIVVKSKIKEVAKNHNVSGDFAEALNEMLVWTVMQGAERAKANGRRTLQARDL